MIDIVISTVSRLGFDKRTARCRIHRGVVGEHLTEFKWILDHEGTEHRGTVLAADGPDVLLGFQVLGAALEQIGFDTGLTVVPLGEFATRL